MYPSLVKVPPPGPPLYGEGSPPGPPLSCDSGME